MPNSPTIVSAALSDKELQDSINKMVANFDKGLQDMLDHSNKYVEKIQESLQKIGNTNFGAKGSNDGGVAKQTKEQKEATNEAEKRVKKEKEINLTLDQRAEIMGRMPREMRMPDMAKSARESFQAFYKGFNEQARQLEPLIQSWERLLQSRHTGNIEQIAQQIRNVKSEIAAVIREQANLSKTKPQGYIDEIAKRNTQIKALRDQLVSLEAEQQKLKATDPFKGNPYLDTLREKLQAAKVAMNDIDTTNRQWLYRTNELTEAQRKLATESMKSFYAHTMKMPTDQYDVQLAKLENIRALLQRIRSGEANFFTTTQVTGLEKEERRLIGLIGQVNAAQQQVTASTQQSLQARREATNQQKQSLDDMNAYIRQNIQREQERREAIRQTGLAARETADQLIRSAHEQASVQGNSPITGMKELTVAVEQMRRAYFDMTATEKASPIGLALEADIKRANEAITVIRKYNQSLLGTEQRNGNNITNTSTLSSLRESLKNLTEQYSKLTIAEIRAGKGDELIQKYQKIGRAAHVLQKQLSTPISFNSINSFNARSLDDIAYKMQMLRSYKQSIDLTKPNAANEIKQVDEALAKLQKDADKWMSKSQEMIKNNTALGRSWNYMKNRLAFYFTVGASTQFVKNLIEIRSQYEMNERALGILINSAERGTQIFNELSQMALVSPYTLIELSAAAKQLTAYDVAAKDVVDTTRRLADMASAVGIPIERLTYALGQIKAYGYLNSRDARMFANAGIPLVKQLSEYYTELEGRLVSTADVYDRIKKKSIDYSDVMQVINHMTDEGGKFFDFQAKMADTLKVRLANLTLAWNNMLNDMGKESQGVLTWGIGALRELFLQWRTFDKTLKEAAGAFGLYKAIQLIILGLQTATKSTLGLNARLTATGVLGTRLVTIFKALGGAMKSLAANWWLVLVAAAVELSSAIINANEATKEFNKSMREGAESTANDLKKYIEQYKEVRDSLYKKEILHHDNGKTGYRIVPQDIDKNEASKAWEAMREQIELSSAASTDFISRLLQIENVSDRLREGFKIIDDIQQVNAALKDMGDEALVVTQKWSAWWNAWQAPDGLFTNLKEFKVELDEIRQKYGDIANARYVAEHGDINRAENEQDAIMRAASEAVNDYDREMNRFRVDLDKYTSSLDNFANAMEFSSNPTQVAELYAKAVKQLVTQGQLNPQEAFDLQLQIEEARTNAMKLALQSRISDEESALKLAQDERVKESLTASIESNKAQLKLFENSTYEQTAYWNDFTKYIKERHISELSAAYNAMTDNGKKEMDFQSSEWQKYVHKWANSYEKSHNLATDSVFNRIKNWINDANTWSIFIKMTISTEDKKSVYKELGEWDKAADDAYKTMQRLDKEISRLRKKGAKEVGVMLENNASADDKKLTQAIEERTQAQKDYNEAVANGGESKKKDAAGSKAQKAAESELAKALKDELSTIDKVRSIYKDLTKEGMSHANAVERATRGWDETVNAINRVLQKNGLQKLDLSKFAGIENPRELVNMLQSQLNTLLKRGAKPAEIKELQTKVNTLEVDADKYDLTKITKGLNNELGKLKDEYELAVELDANPELGSIFAGYMGIDLNELPKNAEEAAKKAQQYIDKILRENKSKEKIDIASLMGKDAFDKWIKSSGHSMEDGIVKVVDNYRQALHKMQVDESKKQMQEWDKLLEKYAEYEYKVTQIQKEAERERETARKKGVSQEILDAIDERERQELAKLSFEEFQKSPEWIVATGDLANMSKSAIGMLIEQLEKYKRSAKNLSPKQIKQLNSALSKLYKEQRKNNPFKAISNMLDEAKERMSTFDEDIKKTQEEIDKLTKKKAKSIADGIADDETDNKLNKAINRLKELKEAREKTGKIDASSWVSSINETISAVQSAIGVFDDLAKAIGGVNGNSDIDKAFSVLESAGSAAATGAQIGGAWGAVIGAVVGAATSLVSIFAGAGNERITAKVEKSERAVEQLENAYKNLSATIEEAYGTYAIGVKQAAIANKELQLVELERQLRLEESRDSKYRDEERIIALKGEIIDLRNEIKKSYQEIATDLLGISSVASAAEEFMGQYIDALRKGEDAQAAFSGSFKEMIANMIKQLWVTKVIGPRLEALVDELNERLTNRSKKEADAYQEAVNEQTRLSTMSDVDIQKEILKKKYGADTGSLTWFKVYQETDVEDMRDEIDAYRKAAEDRVKNTKKELDNAATPTIEDLDLVAQGGKDLLPLIEATDEQLNELLKKYDLYDKDSSNKLSALQQGIQGITEDTAGALEGITNGISQQCYLQSDLLTQIRDTILGFNLDIQMGVLSEILLQLQSSYQVQMSIQGILEGWNNPSGQAVRVELVS